MFIIDDYTKIEIFKCLCDWMDYNDQEYMNNLCELLSQDVRDKYTQNLTIFRGVSYGKLLESSLLCSWTTSFEIAKGFSELESYVDSLFSIYSEVHCVVYKKTCCCLNISLMYNDLLQWAQENEDFITSQTDRQLIEYTKHLTEEYEVISSFSLNDCEEVYHNRYDSIHALAHCTVF